MILATKISTSLFPFNKLPEIKFLGQHMWVYVNTLKHNDKNF